MNFIDFLFIVGPFFFWAYQILDFSFFLNSQVHKNAPTISLLLRVLVQFVLLIISTLLLTFVAWVYLGDHLTFVNI